MSSKAALYWDESFLWGIMAFKALRKLGLDFELLTSEDIRGGRLDSCGAIVVPGGWASNKLKALGDDGARRVRDFVSQGGIYFGICGGAGLATRDGLSLMDVRRKPLAERVPSLSGPVRLRLMPHPLWRGVDEPVFHVWWPSQLELDGNGAGVLAEFERATPDAFSADFSVGDMLGTGWERAEEAYGINLNPEKMAGEPLLIERRYGSGMVIAYIIHFDTPQDTNGEAVLKNLWEYFGLTGAAGPGSTRGAGGRASGRGLGDEVSRKEFGAEPQIKGSMLYDRARELIEFGSSNSLWVERGPLIHWRRGIRGLEYYTLYKLIAELASFEVSGEEAFSLEADLDGFTEAAKKLLVLERDALNRGESLTFSHAAASEIRDLRSSLFSSSKSYGGFFKKIIDRVDAMLLRRLKETLSETGRSRGA